MQLGTLPENCAPAALPPFHATTESGSRFAGLNVLARKQREDLANGVAFGNRGCCFRKAGPGFWETQLALDFFRYARNDGPQQRAQRAADFGQGVENVIQFAGALAGSLASLNGLVWSMY